jgi:acylphosphatase
VWYRESCREVALDVGLAGWVRNVGDGTVEAVLEGPAPAVDHVLTWMRSGPPQASVDEVEVHDEEPLGETGFSLR